MVASALMAPDSGAGSNRLVAVYCKCGGIYLVGLKIGRARARAGAAERMAEATLLKMAAGGVCDHLGGGFHRYSVDELWHVPHFEKARSTAARADCPAALLARRQAGLGAAPKRVCCREARPSVPRLCNGCMRPQTTSHLHVNA